MSKLLVLLALCAGSASAEPLLSGRSDYSLRLTEFSLSYLRYEHLRDPYYTELGDDRLVDETSVNWRMQALKSLYFEGRLHFGMDTSPQVRSGGLEYTLGLEVLNWLDVVRYHHSEHVMEEERDARFPVVDSYGVRIYLVR